VVSKRATEYGVVKMEIHTLGNGKAARLMATVYMSGAMAIDMKESGEHAYDMETVLTSSPIMINTLASTAMVTQTALVNISGQTEIPMLESFLMA
jgi:hypothetical protein